MIRVQQQQISTISLKGLTAAQKKLFMVIFHKVKGYDFAWVQIPLAELKKSVHCQNHELTEFYEDLRQIGSWSNHARVILDNTDTYQEASLFSIFEIDQVKGVLNIGLNPKFHFSTHNQ